MLGTKEKFSNARENSSSKKPRSVGMRGGASAKLKKQEDRPTKKKKKTNKKKTELNYLHSSE